MKNYTLNHVLSDIVKDVSIDEGEEGVRKILVNIYRFAPIPIHDLSKGVMIAVPVVSAVRRVLEKKGLCERKGGVVLTQLGLEILESAGITGRLPKLVSGYQLPDWTNPIVERIMDIQVGRPDPDFSLDQSHVEAVTSALRAAYLYDTDSLEGRSIAFVGDDDLTSLSVGIFMAEFGLTASRITLFDIDERVLKFVKEASYEIDLEIEMVECDLRDGFPKEYMGKYDVFFTDPPYAVDGLGLFVSAGVSMLGRGLGKKAFISYAPKSPDQMMEFFRTILEMGLVVEEVIPSFNRYVGNQMHARASNMIRCVTANRADSSRNIDVDKIYTATQRKPR